MRGRARTAPPHWTRDQLDAARSAALDAFIEERGREGTRAYASLFESTEPIVRRLFEVTHDLRQFTGRSIGNAPELLAAARYLGGPPISADDLETLAGGPLSRRRLDSALADRAARIIRTAWDPVRFPWIRGGRAPNSQERDAAIRWTTSVWAIERLRTQRRSRSSRRQEDAVAATLRGVGLEERSVRTIEAIDDLARASFSREAVLAGSKCDIPVRLRDGRLLAIECKVSNSALNSVKRLLRETGGKSRLWQNAFGRQVVTAAVLAGVYKLGHLIDAQEDYGVTLFWEHDPAPLERFVRQAR